MFKGSSCQAGNVALISTVCPVAGRGQGGSSGVLPPLLRGQSHPAVSGLTTFPNLTRIALQPVGEDCWNAVHVQMFQWESVDNHSGKTRVMSKQGARLKCLQYLCPPAPSSLELYHIAIARCFLIQRGWWSPAASRDTWRRTPTVKLGHCTAADAKCRFFQPCFGSTKPNVLSQMLDEFLGRVCRDEAQVF